MRNMILFEMKNCINRKEFKIVFMTLFLISISAFLLTCYIFYGHPLSFVRSAYESGIIRGNYSSLLLNVEIILLPVFATIIYSDSFYTNSRLGTYKNILTRTDKKIYILSQCIVIFLVTFFTFFIPLLINQLLTFIAFPLVGFDNNSALPPFDLGYQKEYLFDFVRIQWPLLYDFIYMVLNSLFASLFALFGYSLFFLFNKSRVFVIAGMFIVLQILNFVLSVAGYYEYSIEQYLYSLSKGSYIALVLWIVLLLSVSLSIIILKGFKYEIDIVK
ncbi:hypothetical protein J2Z80_000798 [Thermoanaerobacterium butyriciformans]|uniref:ABC-2 family transporter protein n=2 Tax=Thermoanaerobacterium butyriciformans TaxID=1702242 RepID=A0ABS4NE23_9THEO|nr:hypothetical protein [Thermoanaerobacterium butyriciformans]